MIPVNTAREMFNPEIKIAEYSQAIENLLDNKIVTASGKGLSYAHIDCDDINSKMTDAELDMFSEAIRKVFDKYIQAGYSAQLNYLCKDAYAGGWVSWGEENK